VFRRLIVLSARLSHRSVAFFSQLRRDAGAQVLAAALLVLARAGTRGVARQLLRKDERMDYEVTITDVVTRPTAVVPATTTWQEFPTLWGQLLGEVWDCLHAGGIHRGCRNIMLYRDGVPNVEVGVLLDQPYPLTGRVVASALPAGTAAMTVHRGPFGEVGSAHDAVLAWCATHRRRTIGTRWEVYGPHNDDPAEQWTEVYWLLA
jgi:effector-binding domain-containing protein